MSKNVCISVDFNRKKGDFKPMMQDTSTDLMCFYDGGLGFSDYRALISADNAQLLRIDEENRYTLTGETLTAGKIALPVNGCIEIKLFDLGE